MNSQLSILALLLVATGAPAWAQEGTKPQSVPAPALGQDNARGHPMADVIGLVIKTADNKELGEVADLVLDSSDGSIDYLVLAQGGVLGVGDEKYLVPYESVRFAHKDPSRAEEDLQATTALTEERIRKAPKWAKDQRIGPDVERLIREAAGLPPEPMQPRAKNSELVCAQRVKGSPVLGVTQEKIGEMADVIVDPHAGVVAYNVLATTATLGLGEKRFSIPWEVTRVRTEADSKVVIGSELTKDRLATAPEFDSKDPKRMGGQAYMREVFKFYSIEPYFSRAAEAGAARPPRPAEKKRDGK